jgi:hypothetical protein
MLQAPGRARAGHGGRDGSRVSRAAFYLVAASFAEGGWPGCWTSAAQWREPVGCAGITRFIRSAPSASGAVLAERVAERFGVVLHATPSNGCGQR